MKMKKIILFFSMIAVLFSFTGCSDGQEKVEFMYTETDIIGNTILQSYQLQNASESYRAYLADTEEDMAKVVLTAVQNFDTAIEECGTFEGYRSKDGNSIEVDFTTLDNDAYNQLLQDVDAVVEESGNTVVVTLTAVHSKRDVVYNFVYEKNPAFDYAYEIYQQDVAPYQIKEVTVSADYTFGEKMGKAGANTLMGMGTVFIVLIFISFIIAQFEKINKASVAIGNWWINRKNKKGSDETVEAAPAAASVAAPVATANPMDDSQLVAVITAAVVAASTANGGTDKLIVRSIRKAKR